VFSFIETNAAFIALNISRPVSFAPDIAPVVNAFALPNKPPTASDTIIAGVQDEPLVLKLEYIGDFGDVDSDLDQPLFIMITNVLGKGQVEIQTPE
jgi:hypothetical protein